MSFLHSHQKESKSGAGKAIVLALVVLVAAGAAYWFVSRSEEPSPEPEAVPPPPVVEKEEPPQPRIAIPDDLPTTGSLSIRANVDGASVYIEGELVGQAPFEDPEFRIGLYQVKVTKKGYQDFVDRIRVRPGREATLTASLDLLPGGLSIVSDVSGATVFLDREYKGTTPIDIEDVAPGEHELTVSAEGYDMHSETVSVRTGHQEIRVSFQQAAAELHESIAVVHKHTFGECQGTLVADSNGIRYDTNHKDAFAIPYSSLERFEVDYIKKNLNLKVLNGKNYNFTEQSGNADALFVFHKNVKDFLDNM